MRTVSKARYLLITLSILISSSASFSETNQDAIKPKIVLELFTSQGCSSCPPADRILEQLARAPDLITLSRPVQYWDKLGWKDTLATHENTEKQFAYANRWRKIGAYTPQLVIDGSEDVVGNQNATINDRIEQLREHKSGVIVQESKNSDGKIEIVLSGNTTAHADVYLLWLRASTLVNIGRGENAARQVRYVNAVVSEKIVAEWAGTSTQFTLNRDELRRFRADRWAIVIQEAGPGRILGAAYIDAMSHQTTL